MGYKEYVENCILESGLEETGELLEILESAESLDDVEAVERYLSEKTKIGNKIKGAYKSTRDGFADMSADRAEKRARQYGASPNTIQVMRWDAHDRTARNIDVATYAGGAIATGATLGYGYTKLRDYLKTKKEIHSMNLKEIQDDIKSCNLLINMYKEKRPGENLTGKDKKRWTRELKARIKLLEMRKAKLEKNSETTKESVDITDLQLNIFEACESGNITEEDRDDLLKLLDIENNFYTEGAEFTTEPWEAMPKYIRYTSNIQIDGTIIELDEIREISEKSLEDYKRNLSSDAKILKKEYRRISKEEFEKLLPKAEDWETPAKDINDLMKLAGKPDTITYKYSTKKDESAFTIWFNSKAPFNQKFFGCHSFVIDVKIKNGKIDKVSSNLEG